MRTFVVPIVIGILAVAGAAPAAAQSKNDKATWSGQSPPKIPQRK